jgi:hypothetical protein
MLPLPMSTRTELKRGLGQMGAEIGELAQIFEAKYRKRVCREIKYQLAAARFETALIRHALVCRKAGFRRDQPRWPKGSGREGGRWSGGPGSGTQFINNAPTGFSNIDSTTTTLAKTLAKIIDTLPKGRGPLYGIAVHTAFSLAVRFGNIPGIGFSDVETTWGGVNLRYGSLGSIRTDVILRNDVGDPIVIYDVKTGGARLTASRADELRQAAAPGSNIPVIELHLERGASVKALSASANYSLYIVTTLHGIGGVC